MPSTGAAGPQQRWSTLHTLYLADIVLNLLSCLGIFVCVVLLVSIINKNRIAIDNGLALEDAATTVSPPVYVAPHPVPSPSTPTQQHPNPYRSK